MSTNPSTPFTLELYDDQFAIINKYHGNTAVIPLGLPGVVALTLTQPGTTSLSNVYGMQFTWDDAQTINTSLADIAVAAGSFTARAPAGVHFITSDEPDVTTSNITPILGAYLPPGATTWAALSDSNAKTDVTGLNHRETLRKVGALPVTTWQYKHDADRRYIGPMAQDFRAAFGLGHDDKHISTLDTDGVALSALKGLIEELQERKQRGKALDKRLAELEAELCTLRDKLLSKLPPVE